MARITKDQWQQIRKTWEGDDDLTFEELSKTLSVTRQGISKKAHKENWCKDSGRSVKVAQQHSNVAHKVTHHHQVAINALTEIITDKDTPKKIVIAACAELLRA